MAFLLPFQYLHLPNFKFPYELVICLDHLDLNLKMCLKHWKYAQKRVQAKLNLPGPYLDLISIQSCTKASVADVGACLGGQGEAGVVALTTTLDVFSNIADSRNDGS